MKKTKKGTKYPKRGQRAKTNKKTKKIDEISNLSIVQIILNEILKHSLIDEDLAVREMCVESLTEYIIMKNTKEFKISEVNREIGNIKKSIKTMTFFDYYMNLFGLDYESGDSTSHNLISKKIRENASKALRSIAPLYGKNAWSFVEKGIKNEDKDIS